MILTIRGEQEMGRILPSAPFDLVDLLLDLEGFKVVELGFM